MLQKDKWKKIGFISTGTFLVFFFVLMLFIVWSVLNLPKLDNLQDYRPALGSTVRARDGRILGEFYDSERRYISSVDDIPEVVINAFIAAEDDGFFHHSGIDYAGILRAFYANVRAGKVAQGGSTITQQVAKSLLLTPERSIARKLKEVLLAYKIERNLSKRQILHLYLNQIYFGQRAYGVEAAARVYFHKDVKQLTLAESALLAGLGKAPSKFAPTKNPIRARERQVYVLHRMQETGKITGEQFKKAHDEEVRVYPEDAQSNVVAPYYMEHIRQILMAKYGQDAVYRGGLTIDAAADYDLSLIAGKAVRANLEELDKRQGYRGTVGHVATESAMLDELRKIRAEVMSKRFGFNIMPIDITSEKFDESKWVDYTLSLLQKQDSTLLDERRLLQPWEKYRGVVTRIDPDGKSAVVMVGSIKGKLSLGNMRWAKKIKPPETANYAQISRISETLKVGDIILVRPILPLSEKEEFINLSLEQEPLAQSALLSMEASTGYVVAMVGGYDFSGSEYNRALQGERQPGSAFKALLYASAIDKGFTASSIIVDAPIIFDNQGGANLKWIPENNSEKFYGDTTLRTAIINSRNVPAVKLAQEMGLGYYINYLRALGIQGELSPDLSIALGSKTISLLELTKLYALFPRLGQRIEPVFLLKVTDRDGKVLEQYSFTEYQRELSAKWLKQREAKEKPADSVTETANGTASPATEKDPNAAPVFDDPLRGMDEKTAYVMSHLLQEVVQFGTGTNAKVLKRKVGGKTGTTNDFVDAWFMGFSPELITGVWTGFDNPRSLGKGEVGSRAALPAWIDYMAAALEKYKSDEYAVPKGIVFVRIDPKTGALAGPANSNGVKEAYIEGTEPSTERQNKQTPDSSDFFREDL